MDTKPFYASKTFWGVVIMAVTALLAKYGYVIDESLQNETAEAVVFIVGTVIALIGRWQAAKPLSVAGNETSRYVPLLLVACLLCLGTGCGCMSRAEHAAWRDGFYQGSTSIREEHKDFAASIAGDNDRNGVVDARDASTEPTPLPSIQELPTPNRNTWYQERLRTHYELEQTYRQDQSHDGGVFGTR